MINSTERFSDRVENYVKYRPSYPKELFTYLSHELGLNKTSIVADIGSGTGILTQELLAISQAVYGIEPNKEMRLASIAFIGEKNNYFPIDSTSEHTKLTENSIDIITVAQAFHWFNTEQTLIEFRRILKNEGKMVLIWNNRINNTEFLKKYDDALIKYGTDYNEVNHQNLSDEKIMRCFSKKYHKVSFPNFQEFNFDGVLGRLSSSSYAPKNGTKEYQIIKETLQEAFTMHSIDGKVRFNYNTDVYHGEI